MSSNRILVIESDKATGQSLLSGLRDAGYEPTLASSGSAALRLARTLRPDLVTLEVDLPDVSGMDICRALRAAPETRRTPIVVISSRNDEIDRVVLFELGADDYITKPFSFREVALRVRARLRRASRSSEVREPVRHGDLELDLDGHRVIFGDNEIMLTPTEARLMEVLCATPNHVLRRVELHERVWGRRQAGGSRVIDAQIKRLRKKLGAAGRSIETVRGVGYRFVDASDATARD